MILARKPSVGVCGESASDPVMALLLLGMGIDNLSVGVTDVPRIKWPSNMAPPKLSKWASQPSVSSSHSPTELEEVK